MKKALSVLIALLMLLSLFACNNGASPDTSSPPPSVSQTPSPSPSTLPPPATPSATPTETAVDKYGGVLKIVNSAEGAAAIGIPWSASTLESLLKAPFFEHLLVSTTDGVLEPQLAESWTVDLDKKEIVLNIRKGVKFHDGSDFTAEVAAWNLQMGIDVKQYNQNITACEARDDYTLAVKFETWTNSIIFNLSSYFMCSKESYEKNGEEWAAENPIGTGPFAMTEYVRGQYIKAARFEDYWQDGKPYLDGIEFHFIRDPVAQNMAMQSTGSDRIDVLNINSAEQVSLFKAQGFTTFSLYTGPVVMYPGSKDTSSPLSKVEVRKAISYALDRDAIVAARGFGICTPGLQWVESNSMAHLPDSYNQSFSIEKAKELLTEAGYPDGFHTTLITQPGVADRDSTVAIQKMLEAVGITSDLEFPDSGAYAALRASGWDGICIAGARQFAYVYNSFYLYFDYNDIFYVSVARPNGWEDALRAAERTPEPDAEALQAVHKVLIDNMMGIPIYNITDNWVFQDNVNDTYYGYYEHVNLADAWLS